jgi:hypothetical protein
MKSTLVVACALLALATFVSGQTAPYTEDFDTGVNGTSSCTVGNGGTLPLGWAFGAGSTGDWTVWSGSTGSSGTGPTGDHTTGTGKYLYCETSGCTGGTFHLESPLVDMTPVTAADRICTFWYHMWGATTGTLEAQVSDGIGGWNTALLLSGDQGNAWRRASFPLGAATLAQVRFRYVAGTSFTGDAAIDDVTFGPLPPAPAVAPEFETNSAESSTDLDGSAVRSVCAGTTVNWSLDSSLVGNPFDVIITLGHRAALSGGGVATNGLQTLNIPLASFPTLFFLNQFTTGSAQPHTGTIDIPLTPAGLGTACAQQIVIDPGHADGFSLSQAVQLIAGPTGFTDAGPTTDDSSLSVVLNSPVPFCGTSFTNIFIISNGRLTFGAADTDFSPSLLDADDDEFFGCWTDLNPAIGGVICYNLTSTGISVAYTDVSYFGEAAGPTSMILSAEDTGDLTIDVSGMRPNPLNALTASDAVILGLSSGNLVGATATDPGPTSFTSGGAGSNALATDMIYDFVDFNTTPTIVPGQIDSITNLQLGPGVLIFSPGINPGDFSWSGL